MSEVIEKIVQVIESEVRPALESHGGGIEFKSFNEADGVLTVILTGMCSGCPGARATIQNMVLNVINSSIPEVKEVVQA